MKEDYVSFEIAKLLKEKGFDEYCRAEWLEYIDGPSKGKTYLTECGSGLQHDSCSNTSLEKFNYDGQMFYAAPTLQMATKWLREVHNMEIAITYGIIFDRNTTRQVFRYFWSIVKVNGLCLEYPMNNPGDICNKEIVANSYEEAVEAALKYCLTNLI